MSQTTYQVDVSLSFSLEQIKQIILSLPLAQQEEILTVILRNRPGVKENCSEKLTEDALKMVAVFERLSQNAQAKGLTEEILEELLADES